MSGNEVSQIILSLVLSYYGGNKNRPRWIGIGVAFCAMSCFILALPHLVYGAGHDALQLTQEYGAMVNSTISMKGSAQELCLLVENGEDCSVDNTFAKMPLALIFISQFVLGIGTTLYYSLGQTYLDDNTNKNKTPLMLGCVLALRTVGPAFGFLLGFGCLSLYISPSLTPLIEKDDPRWLGAWWLGWVILGCLKLVVAAIITMFPKELPKKSGKIVLANEDSEEQPLRISLNLAQDASPKIQEKQKNIIISVKDSKISTLEKGFFPALKRLLNNKLLMCNNLSTVFYILGASGYITFVMKYMETQFQQAAASATGFAGCIAISAMVIGFLVSGIVISHFKPRALYVLSWNVLAGSCYLVCEIIFIYLSCPNNLTQNDLYNVNGKFDLSLECSQDCSCSSKYSPVCDTSTNTSFYSPCYAGCSQVVIDDTTMMFTNCSCPETLLKSTDTNFSPTINVIPGVCSSDCTRIFFTFLAIQFFMHFLGNTGKIGNILITYRCVNVEDKSFAQGLTLFMISLFAFIPGPILYGAIIDSTCLVWEETCDNRGNCWLYNPDTFRLYINSTAACLTSLAVALDVAVCYLGKSLSLYEDENEKKLEEKESNSSEK